MKIELTSDQVHWTKYALIKAIATLSEGDQRAVKPILMRVMSELNQPTIDPSKINIHECLTESGKALLIVPNPIAIEDREKLYSLVETAVNTLAS